MLILPIQEQERSFHFLVSSSISFFKDLKFLSNRSFTSLVRVTPSYFMLFVTFVKGDVSLIFLSTSLSFVYRRATDFLELILYPATLLKVFINCRIPLVEFLGSLMYTIISSANNESLTSYFPIWIPLTPYVVVLLFLELQALYWRGMERVDSLVLFLILVERPWVSLHSTWY